MRLEFGWGLTPAIVFGINEVLFSSIKPVTEAFESSVTLDHCIPFHINIRDEMSFNRIIRNFA